MRGRVLEATTKDTASLESKGQTEPEISRRTQTRRAVGWAAAVVIAALALWALLQITMDVPDTNSPVVSNHMGTVDAANSVGQTFVPRLNNLDQLSLLLSAEQPNDYSSVTLTVRDGGPNGTVLRTVKEQLSNLPTGDPFSYDPFHSAILDPRWSILTFDPIPDSAGRKLFFSIEGKYVPPPSKVKVAMMFRGGYPDGTAYVNGSEQNAHVVFRAESMGSPRDYLGVLAENVTIGRQGPAANSATYTALAAVYALLLAVLLRTAWRALRQ